jgi:putative FmdB family regulatory protein
MPIYEYRCGECGHTLDALQKLNDDPLKHCPECESDALKRLISAPAFRLKGGGWYETDFKSDKEKRRNLVESSSEGSKSDGQAGDSKSTESKSGESKASESKSGASKGGDGKKSESADKAAPKKSNGKGTGSEAA